MSNDISMSGSETAGPQTELDMLGGVVNPDVDDELLDEVNLGTGNLSTNDYWVQNKLFEDGLFAEATLSETIVKRAFHQTKREVGAKGYVRLDDGGAIIKRWAPVDEREDHDRALEWGEQIWMEITPAEQMDALDEVTGLAADWTPPHWRVLKARHELSKSKGARLLDNFFGRVQEVFGDGVSDDRLQQLEGSR